MKPFKGNIHWLLFGLSNMYNNAVELLVPEIITNAIEASADKIIISFRKEAGNYFITFHNNGEKVSKSVFDKFNMFVRHFRTVFQSFFVFCHASLPEATF